MNPFPTETSRLQAELTRTIGERMRKGREMWNWSLTCAAKKLGYRNPSKLSKIENAKDAHSVPLHIIYKAAEVYGVSIDYLFGITDDWERDPQIARERSVAKWVGDEWQRQKSRDLAVFAVLAGKIASMERMLVNFQVLAGKARDNLDTFTAANSNYEDMPKLNPLVCTINRFGNMAEESASVLRRLCKDSPIKPCEELDLNKVVDWLAGLNDLEYEQARMGEAGSFGIRPCFLDRLVKTRRIELNVLEKARQQLQLDL